MEIFEYQTSSGRRPYLEWIRQLKDRQGAAVIRNRINRLRLGQFGDHRSIGDGVWELRLFSGPGYRIYYLMDGRQIVILLFGGDKDSQSRDIVKVKEFSVDYWRRK
jgi:putative addiction module killer protein